jgi:hypothetical protein
MWDVIKANFLSEIFAILVVGREERFKPKLTEDLKEGSI